MSDYFSSKLQALSVAGGNAKKQNIADAFEQKLQGLRDAAQARKQVEAQDKAIYEGSIVGRLGLTPEQDPFLHGVVNEAVRLGSGASHTLGQVAAAGEEFLREGISTNSIPQEVRDARARQLQGKATADDIALLNAPSGFTKAPTYEHVTPEQFAKIHKDKGTNLSRIQEWEKNQDELAKTRAYHDVSGLVDRRGDRPAKEQLRAGASDALVDWESAKNNFEQGNYLSAAGDALKTAGKLANNTVEVAADNPMAAFGAVVENAPQLLAGALLGVPGTVVTAGSYAINEYQDAVADYRKKNNGAMPSKEWVAEQTLKGGSLGAVEGVSDRLTLGMGKVLKAAGKATDGAVDGLEAGFKKSLANAANKVAQSAVPRIAAGGAIGATGEYITEAIQANIENSMRGEDTSFEDTHMAGAMGAWAGGPVATLASVGEVSLPKFKSKEDTAPEQADALKQAIADKNPDVFLDPKSASYNPKEALNVLHKLSNAAEATPEQKAQYQAKAKDVIDGLQATLGSLKDQTDGGKADLQKQIAELEAKMATTDPANTKLLAAQANALEALKDDLQEASKSNPDEPKLKAEIKAIEKRLESAQSVYALMIEEQSQAAVKDTDVATTFAEANAAIDPTVPESATKSRAAGQKLAVLSMASPDAVSWQDAEALGSNTANGLTKAQRTYFKSYAKASKAITELKTMAKVSKEVFDGDPALNQLGLLDYRTKVGQFLSVGDLDGANRYMRSMSAFLSNHKAKNEVFKKAWAEFNSTGKPVEVIKDVAGNWHLASDGMKAKAQRKYSIKADSGKLVENVRKEANAIAQNFVALRAAIDVAAEIKAPNNAQTSPSSSAAQQPADVGATSTQETVNTTTQEAAPQAIEPTVTQPAPDAGVTGATEANGVTGTPPVNIWFGSGQNSELSNLASRPFTYAGKKFFSVEHAYQSWKSGKFDAGTYNKYKGAGKKIVGNQGTKTKDGWNLDLMRSLVQASFDQNPAAAEQLLSTGNAQLTHTQDTGIWKNEFPRILMEVRESLVSQQELAAPWEDSQDLVDLRAKFPGSTFREATSEEQGIISDAFATMVMRLGDAFNIDSTVLVEEGDKHLGNFTFENGILTLNAKLFTQGIASVGVTDPELATMIVMTHEQSHAMDRANGYPSQVSAQLREGGDIYEQAKAIVSDKAHLLYKWLKNPVFGRDSEPHGPDEIASELYAQSFTLYVYNKELMRETFPAAYQFVEATIGADSTGAGSTTAEAVRTSADTGANPAVAGQSEQAGSTSEGQDSQLPGSDERVSESEDSAPVDAQLNVLANAAEDSLLAKWLKQAKSTAQGAASRPLTAIKNFMSEVRGERTTFEQFLPDGELSGGQNNALNYFYSSFFGDGKKNKGWAHTLRTLVPTQKNDAFSYEKVAQYLMEEIDGRLDFEENVKAAMVMAGIVWAKDTYGNRGGDHAKLVNQVLMRDEDTEVTEFELNTIPRDSVRHSVAAGSLGRAVMQALGLKATKEASNSFKTKMEASLGAYVLALLEKQGIIEEHTITDKVMQDMLGGKTYKERQNHYFVRLALKKNGTLADAPGELIASVKESKGVLESLFGVESRSKPPTLEPVPFNIKQAKGSRTLVPKWLAEILDKKNHEKNFVAKPMHDVLMAILGTDNAGLETFLQIAGAQQVDRFTHVRNVKGMEAKKAGLLRELEGVLGFIGDLMQTEGKLDTPFYLQHEPWNQQRVGILNNVFNPQNSKIARYLTSRTTWQSEVDPNNEQQMTKFKLRVLEGMGVKTDKKANSVAVQEWNAVVAENAVVQAAVDALVEAQQGKALSSEQRQAVLDAVQQGKESMHTLHVLSALAQHKAANGEKFTVTLLGEVDGVTNGPMLSNLMLGAASAADKFFGFLNKGGFFEYSEDGNGQKAYNVYRGQPGVKDLYETIASKILARMVPATWNVEFAQAAQAVFSFTGNLGEMGVADGTVESKGRNIVKRPITALHFGSSTYKAVDGMAEDFIDGIYSAIEAEARAGGENRVNLIERINQVIGKPRNHISKHMSMEALLKFEFNEWQIRGMKATFNEVVGKQAKEVLETEFYSLLARRDSMVIASGVAFGLFDAAYKALEQGFIDYLVGTKAEGIELDSAGNLKWDLTPEQQKDLDSWVAKMQPTLHTMMSLQDGERSGLKAGLSMAKVGEGQTDSPSYQAAIATHNTDPHGNKTNTRTVSAMRKIFKSPGVAMFSKSIHSLDSFISHLSVSKNEALNNHDANTTGFMSMEATAQNLNGATWEALVGYSPAEQMFQALNRTVLGLAKLMSDPEFETDLAPSIKGFLEATIAKWQEKSAKSEKPYGFDGTPSEVLRMVLMDAKVTAFEADSIRLGVASKVGVIDQYAMEGGGYEVSAEQRAEAEAKLKGLTKELPKETLDALAVIQAALEGKKAQKTESEVEFPAPQNMADLTGQPDAQTKRLISILASAEEVDQNMREMLSRVQEGMAQDKATLDMAVSEVLSPNERAAVVQFLVEQFKDGVTTPLGKIGPSRTASDPQLAAFFERHPKLTGKQLMGVLKARMAEGGDTRFKYMTKIWDLVNDALSDVDVVYVTPQTIPEDILAMPDFASRGWFVKGGNTLYVLSPEFANSGLDVELLMHELVHSALEHRLHNPKSAKQKQAKAELEALLKDAKSLVSRKFPLDMEMKNAVSSLDELVAYGMTNAKFQNEVLRQLTVTTPQGFTDGLKKFVTAALALLGLEIKSDKDGQVDGFTALMVNGAIMFQAQADANARQAKKRALQVQSMASPGQQVDNYSTQEVFDALPAAGVSDSFNARLQQRLQTIVNKMHGPFGALKVQIEQSIGKTALDVWSHLQAAGQRPFAAKVLATGARFTQREAYVAEQIEAVVREVIDNKTAANSVTYNELEKIWQQARVVLKGKIDADLYEAVFMPKMGANGKSDYLSTFAALALANEEFNQALAFETQRPELVLKGKTFMERLEAVWRSLSDWVGARMTGTYVGQQANTKIDHLVGRLVQIEARKKSELQTGKSVFDLVRPAEQATKGAIAFTKNTLSKAINSGFVKNSSNGFLKAAGTVGDMVVSERVGTVVDALNAMRDKTNELTAGEAMSMVNYIKGPAQWVNKLMLLGKQVEKNRLAVINDTAKAVLHAFKDRGEKLTQKDKHAITVVFIRSGLHVLEKAFGVRAIQEMLESPSVLNTNIAAVEARLKAFPQFDHYIMQAKGLAYYRMTERVTVFQQMTNAGNIARMFGTGKPVPAHAEQAEKDIEQLVAMYALRYADENHKQRTVEVMRTEANRGTENGIEMVLKMQAHLDQEARDKLFQGSEALRMHGFTPEILNPHVTFQVTRDPVEAAALLDAGYVKMPKAVSLDPADPDKTVAHMYVLNGGGMARRVSGVFSFTGMAGKGESKHNNYYNPATGQGAANMQSMMDIYRTHETSTNAMQVSSLTFDPSKVPASRNLMLPLLNAQGQVVDYRYVMNAKTKDTLMERNNDFDRILGTLAGSIYDKPASREQNKRVVQALRDHYVKTAGDNPEAFIAVSHNSPDARMREAWDMLPDETKKDIRAIWGMEGLKVPKSMADVLFGYRKASLADAYDKADPNALERLMMREVALVLKVYAKMKLGMTSEEAERFSRRGAVTIRRGEAAWQEATQMVKDFIVNKTGTVLLGNVLSNMALLAMKGVPFMQGMKYQLTALRGALDYERDRAALAQLKALQQTGYNPTDLAEIRAEIVRLEDSLARNPVKRLIDAGLMPTIVEDVTMEDDPYSYKTRFTQWSEDKLSGVNTHVKTVGKWALMTHDTPIYKVLSKATQYSDFVARYALFMHVTQRRNNPLSYDDAVFEASESFVNYDLPLPKHVQYLDDMGLTPFIKYFFSIQRVLAKTFKDDPLQVLSVLAMGNFLGGLPMPTDSSFLVRIGNNPLDVGALGLPSAMMETLTIQSAMSLIK